MKTPEEAVRRICHYAEAFMASEVLFTASGAGLFELLREKHGTETIAARLGWNAESARLFLNALAAMELVIREEDSWRNSPAATACLAGGEADLTAFLRHMARGREAWKNLPETLQSGSGLYRGQHPPGTPAFDDFMRGMDQIARRNAPALARAIDLRGCASLLDAGCGGGAYAAAFLEENPGLAVTLLDTPPVLEGARENLAERGHANRCRFLPGTLEDIPAVPEFDAVFISNLLHAMDENRCRGTLRKMVDLLLPGGRLIVRDFFTGWKDDPLFSHFFALHLRLHTESGRTWTREDLEKWTREAGFTRGTWQEPGAKARVWIGRKPGGSA
jgi:ubiquinone/menaquinone biosynthesis C-methylase UbiE